jgi:hypothetical protein
LEPTIFWSNIGLPLGIGVSYKASMSNLAIEFEYDTSASSSTYHYINIIENGDWTDETLPAVFVTIISALFLANFFQLLFSYAGIIESFRV